MSGKVYLSFIAGGQFCQVKHSWLAGFFFSLSLKTLTISSPFLIVSKVSAVNPTDSFMGTPLYEMELFVLVSFLPLTRSKLYLIFWQFSYALSQWNLILVESTWRPMSFMYIEMRSFQCGKYFTVNTYVQLAGYTLQICTILSIMPQKNLGKIKI